MRALTIALAGLMIAAAPSAAQRSADVAYRAMGSNNDPLGDPAGVRLSIRNTKDRRALWLAGQRLTGTQQRFGWSCAGLIAPGACPQEPLTDRSRLVGLEAGASYAFVATDRFALEGVGAFHIVEARATTTGQSGRTLNAETTMWGPEIGADLFFSPVRRSRVGVVLGARLGGMIRVARVAVDDGYEPFGAVSLEGVHIGLRTR